MNTRKKLNMTASVAFICICVSSAIVLVTLAHSNQRRREQPVSTIAFVSTRHMGVLRRMPKASTTPPRSTL